MINYTAIIHQFAEKGEKTGWTYLDIPAHIAHEIKPDCKISFRVKGKLDTINIEGIALVSMGEGDFILPIKKDLKKKIGKSNGAPVSISIEEDKDFKYEIPVDLATCFDDVDGTLDYFLSRPKSHQNYFIRWIGEAKTESTRVKRLIMTVNAMIEKLDYGEMIRLIKGK
jgi:hypothetical protein